MFSIEEPAISEGIDPLRSEPEEEVDPAIGSTGTTPIVEPDALADSCTAKMTPYVLTLSASAAGARVARKTESQTDNMAETGISSPSQCGS